MDFEKGNLTEGIPKEPEIIIPIKPTVDEIFEKIGVGLWELRELNRLKYGTDYELKLVFNVNERSISMKELKIIEDNKEG